MTIPRNVQRGAVGLVVLLMLASLYQAFSAASELQQALDTIRHVQFDLSVARDSLVQARAQINRMVREISRSQQELRIIREQVQTAGLRYEQQQGQGTQEREVLHARWRTQEALRQGLQQEAQKFSVE